MKIIYNSKTKEIQKEKSPEYIKDETELKNEKVNEIKMELEELDKTINRATEDLYTLTNSTPYASVAEVISRKNELRQELKEVL